MSSNPLTLHSAAQVRAIDRQAIERLGIDGYALMARAGAAAYGLLESLWPRARRILVVCGSGNNAGDGYVLARLARRAHLDVVTVRLFDPAQLSGDAKRAWEDFAAEGGVAVPWDEALLAGTDVIVDAIFGTGLSRSIEGSIRSCIDAINASGTPVLALDVPSGLDADTGRVMGAAVRAACCITFVGGKLGFYLGDGPDHTGRVVLDPLGLPPEASESIDCVAMLLSPAVIPAALPPRRASAHKGDFGHVLVVGGGPGMPGAARLCGEGALRAGAGRVTVACAPQNVVSIVTGRPELMCVGIDRDRELEALLERVDIVALGPGLATEHWSHALFERVIATELPLIIDADALNLLAREPRGRGDWVLTPHPGEAARLLEQDTGRVQADRISSARELVDRYGGVAVLKGAGSLVVCEGELPRICGRGNPGMAAPGMGDVLTGVIAGIAAQSRDLWTAALAGVYLHALAGDRVAAERGQRGLLAGDVIERLPECLNDPS
jgi:hydroxyethylthiazole kinase-like uncharacterized protein yjeF